jgi:hypothetical protein
VQRLDEISGDDRIAEGIWNQNERTLGRSREAVFAYSNLWELINGAGSWDANPWVLVLTFKVHLCNIDALLAQMEKAA